MMRLHAEYRAVWDLLFDCGCPYTTAQLAQRLGVDTARMVQVVSNLKRRRLIAEVPPAPGTWAARYEVNGLCVAPQGAALAELQANFRMR
ncbi:hypothetical protein PY257_16155 [Ramlibacter sp. H39-3-26]|uniref:hypothetical protein n=1 Tax=Curvibacter soli TaxID=3031331 RepID=UPI0023DC7C6B|nr:hypothetical protein [Ramlibacter sp. H39-3-26]MDF1486687.1 hypothetical protein [Ramlibacter sp. H39-3-26]